MRVCICAGHKRESRCVYTRGSLLDCTASWYYGSREITGWLTGVSSGRLRKPRPCLHDHWERIKSELLEDRYQPLPVKAVEIPKPDGGTRMSGIPVVVDRLIGQALHQVYWSLYLSRSFRRTVTASYGGVAPIRQWYRRGNT
jgi:hypothetical protein